MRASEILGGLILAHLQRMTLAMDQNKPLDPADICLLRPDVVASHPDRLSDSVEQFSLVPLGNPAVIPAPQALII
jgi:hypothetical protein